eukprot:2265742-Pyramimonas_sp.AAC.1
MKSLTAALEFSKVRAKHAAFASQVVRQYKSSCHFLSLEPSAPRPFPKWVRRRALNAEIEETWVGTLLRAISIESGFQLGVSLNRPRGSVDEKADGNGGGKTTTMSGWSWS